MSKSNVDRVLIDETLAQHIPATWGYNKGNCIGCLADLKVHAHPCKLHRLATIAREALDRVGELETLVIAMREWESENPDE